MYSPEEWGGARAPARCSTSSPTRCSATRPARRGGAGAAGADRAAHGSVGGSDGDGDDAGRCGEADYDNGLDAYYGNQCADTQYPATFAEFRFIDVYAAAGSRFGPLWWWGDVPCATWPVNADRYVGPWTARTSAPVLVVGNFFDGVTDHAGAVASARLLGNARLLSYAGWGHTAYDRSACVTDFVNAYLLRGALPAPGTCWRTRTRSSPPASGPAPRPRHRRTTADVVAARLTRRRATERPPVRAVAGEGFEPS